MDKYKGLESIFGTFYPKGFIVAIFENQEDSSQAAKALQQAGFSDVRQFTDQEVLDRHRTVTENRNVLQRIGGAISSDELAAADDYVESARLGHQFLVVQAAEPMQIEHVRTILFSHHAHGVKHYGEWTVTDLMAS